jgi:hypothetical protein
MQEIEPVTVTGTTTKQARRPDHRPSMTDDERALARRVANFIKQTHGSATSTDEFLIDIDAVFPNISYRIFLAGWCWFQVERSGATTQ